MNAVFAGAVDNCPRWDSCDQVLASAPLLFAAFAFQVIVFNNLTNILARMGGHLPGADRHPSVPATGPICKKITSPENGSHAEREGGPNFHSTTPPRRRGPVGSTGSVGARPEDPHRIEGAGSKMHREKRPSLHGRCTRSIDAEESRMASAQATRDPVI